MAHVLRSSLNAQCTLGFPQKYDLGQAFKGRWFLSELKEAPVVGWISWLPLHCQSGCPELNSIGELWKARTHSTVLLQPRCEEVEKSVHPLLSVVGRNCSQVVNFSAVLAYHTHMPVLSNIYASRHTGSCSRPSQAQSSRPLASPGSKEGKDNATTPHNCGVCLLPEEALTGTSDISRPRALH